MHTVLELTNAGNQMWICITSLANIGLECRRYKYDEVQSAFCLYNVSFSSVDMCVIN